MASFIRVVHLSIIAGLALYTTEGLLLQKHVPQLLDGGEQRYLDALPYFTKSAPSGAGEFVYEAGSPSTVPPLEKDHPGTGSDPEKMYLRAAPTRLAMGVLSKSTTPKSDFFNLLPVAMQAITETSGMVVTQIKEHESAAPTATLRFGGEQETYSSCNSSKPLLLAKCGDQYLFPGYNVKLVNDEGLAGEEAEECLWRFRQWSKDFLVTLKGVEPKHDVYVGFEQVDVFSSFLVTLPRGERRNKKLKPSRLTDLLISLPKHAEEKGISVEVCVPDGPGGGIHEGYEIEKWECCSEYADGWCGIPKGSLKDKDFGMNTMPWQALITVTVEYQSPSGATKYATTYCSGSLVTHYWVLTTASCLLRPENDHPGSIPSLFVTFGSGKDSEKIEVAEFVSYPTVTEDHDVALIRLSRRTERRSVCLPGYHKPLSLNTDILGRKGTVFGWVVESEDVHYMTTLNQTILSSDKCSSRLGKKLAPHILCTEDHTKGNPCLADGNLLVESAGRFVLRGLVTPRLHCNDDYRPHSSVTHFMPWISHVTSMIIPN